MNEAPAEARVPAADLSVDSYEPSAVPRADGYEPRADLRVDGSEPAADRRVEGSAPSADPRVDDAVSRLAELDALPLTEQVEVFADIHRRLAAVLADPGSQA